MHRSRLAGIIIDCRPGELPSAARFWSEARSARRVAAVGSWWVLEAPTGHRFCVVQPCTADFEAQANTWP